MSPHVTRGVVLDLATLHPTDLDLNALRATLPDWSLHDYTAPAERAGRLHDAQIVVSNKVVLDAATLASATQLKLICIAATGVNNVDLAAATQRGIAVTNVTGYATASVAELVFALILTLQRRLDAQRQAAYQLWPQQPSFSVLDFPTAQLAGKTLGIVGYGALGQAVARIGRAFDMRIALAQRSPQDRRQDRMPLDALLREADVLSLHCPLNDNTHHLIGAPQLALMKPTALLINTARGGLIDESALLYALQTGRLAGAGLDVLSEEPPPAQHPLLTYWAPNLIITPHIAWANREARQTLVDEVRENIRAFLRGERRNRLDTQQGIGDNQA